MNDDLKPDSSIKPVSSSPPQDPMKSQADSVQTILLTQILQTLVYIVNIEARRLVRLNFDESLFGGIEESIQEINGLKRIMDSLKRSTSTIDQVELSNEFLDDTIMFFKGLQERIEKEIEAEVVEISTGPKLKFFSLLEEPDDLWGIIKRANDLIARYAHLSHLTLPAFWLEVIKELHRYNSGDHLLLKRVIETLSLELETIIGKLLREAPCSGLLQTLKRRYESSIEYSSGGPVVLPEDQSNIKAVVHTYIETAEKLQEGIIDSADLRRKADYDVKNFSLGGGGIESRIPKVAYDVANNLLKSASGLPPQDERGPYLLNAISLIVALNQVVIESSDLSSLLKELKI